MLKNCLKADHYCCSDYADMVRSRMMVFDHVSDDDVFKLCEDIVMSSKEFELSSPRFCGEMIRKIFCCVRCELELLQDFVDDPEITEIMVNGPKNIFIEKNGLLKRANCVLDNEKQLIQIIQRLAAKVGREINDLNPILDARLSDGSRINAVNSNIAIDGPILTIRKFSNKRMCMDDLILNGDITKEAAEDLAKMVQCGFNIFVSGGTSSGKTTFLNILSDYISPDERIIVIEDSSELKLKSHENLVRLEAKSDNIQGKGKVDMKTLVRCSLRMRPDRIIVGEVRGDEVVDMLAAMSTGHDGSLSTGHANSPEGMINRLESLHVAASNFPSDAVRTQIFNAIDVIVQLKRFKNGQRKVVEIAELSEMHESGIKLNTIYKYKDGQLEHVNDLQYRKEKLFEQNA